MLLVEKHYIKSNTELDRLASCSALLYDQSNYYLRQAFFKQEKLPNIVQLIKLVEKEEFYINFHNTKTCKKLLRQLYTDWSNFFKSLKAYSIDPSKYKGRPKPPKYKKKEKNSVYYDYETIRKKPVKKGIITPTNDCFRIKSNRNFKQIIVKPYRTGYMVCVSYEIPDVEMKKANGHYMFIDLGVNNLCAITSDQFLPILINGRIVKSINQLRNKYPNEHTLEKRDFQISNYFHNVSRLIINLCKTYDISKIIIGHNNGWKQDLNLGKRTNQNFSYIPFNILIEQIIYKSYLEGIETKVNEESYTSKASYIDKDELPVYEAGKTYTFSGKRIKRGLYRSKNGIILNSDVNGSGNIGRKVILNDKEFFVRLDSCLAVRPRKLNPLIANQFLSKVLESVSVHTFT